MDYESLSFKLYLLEEDMAEICISIEETKWMAVASALVVQDGEGLAPRLAALQDQFAKISRQAKDLRWYLYGK